MDKKIMSIVAKHVADPIGANFVRGTNVSSGMRAVVDLVPRSSSLRARRAYTPPTSGTVMLSLALLKSIVA
jgi:hypothetical protein